MIIKPYQYVSELYAHLMKSIDYEEWAQYILEIAEVNKCGGGSALEIGSGNCTLASYLKDEFNFYAALDLSEYMLKKSAVPGLMRVCADMKNLPFQKKIDFIFSSFDSVNYLLDKDELLQFFKSIKTILNEGGILTFDASLERNSIKHVRRLNRKGKFEKFKYIQKSSYSKKEKIHTNHFKIKLNDGTIVEELHRQKIYPLEDYFEVIEDAGLVVKNCYEAFSFDETQSKSERAQFIVQQNL